MELDVPSEFTTRNITVGGIRKTKVSINDDDCVIVTITTDEVGTTEGSNLPLTVTVDGNFSEPFDVVITMTDGTATGVSLNGYSYQFTSPTIWLPLTVHTHHLVTPHCTHPPPGYPSLYTPTTWLPLTVHTHHLVTPHCTHPPPGYPSLYTPTTWLALTVHTHHLVTPHCTHPPPGYPSLYTPTTWLPLTVPTHHLFTPHCTHSPPGYPSLYPLTTWLPLTVYTPLYHTVTLP